MSKELRECPFCGKSDKVTIYTESRVHNDEVLWTRYAVKCRRCLFEIPSCTKKEAAIRYWNTRPAEDAKDKEIERLKSALREIAYFRDLNPDLQAADFSVNAETGLKNLYCVMGNIAKMALATDANVPTNATDMEKGGEDE